MLRQRFILKNLSTWLRMQKISSFAGPFNFMNGKRVPPVNCKDLISVTEPSTGSTLCQFPCSTAEDVSAAVQSAQNAFHIWAGFSPADRAKVLKATAQKIQERINDIAILEVRDCGKPLWEAKADILACADTFDYFGGVLRGISGHHIRLSETSFAVIQREPLGVCGAIGAWNFPFQVASWKAAPALACGNTMVFKPSPLTPLTTVVLAEILHEAGLPEGGFNVLQGAAETGRLLCEHPKVAKVSFTGSIETGVQIMKSTSPFIKPLTLELGGKSPLIVFEDCNLDNAVKAAMVGNFLSQGQVCSNATRIFVQKSVLNKFLDKLVFETKKLKIGDPFKKETQIGATITKEHAEKVLKYIQSAVDQGAKMLCGGERVTPTDKQLINGYYLSPCILSECQDNMTAIQEEIFGAVLGVLSFETENEVVSRANDTRFGLAGGVFTNDIARAHRVANNLKAGIVWINNYNLYPPEVPFGGYKMSGIGRENGLQVLEHYSQTKTIMIEMNNVESPFS